MMNRESSNSSTFGSPLKVALMSSAVLIATAVLGVIAALFPAETTIKLGVLLVAGLVFILALFAKGTSTEPEFVIRLLLLITLFVDCIWPVYLTYKGLPGPNINPERLAYWCLAGLWMFWFVASKQFKRNTFELMSTARLPLALLLGYLGWAAIASLHSGTVLFSLHFQIKLFVGPLLLLFVILGTTSDQRDVDRVLRVLMLAALIAAGLGILEGLRRSSVFHQYLSFMMPSITDRDDEWAARLTREPQPGSSYRILGTYSHPLSFAEYLTMMLPVALYFSVYGQRVWRWIGLFALPAIGLALFYTHTRSGLIAAGVSTITMTALLSVRAMRRRNNFAGALAGGYTLIILVVVAMILAGAMSLMIEGRNRLEAGSTMARVLMFERGADLIAASPLLGYGPGKAAAAIGYLPGFKVLTIDSYYLSAALETGIPGLMLLVTPFLYLMGKGMREALRSDGQRSAQVLAISSGLFSFMIFRSTLSLLENFWLAFVYFALLVASLRPGPAHEGSDRGRASEHHSNGSPPV